MSDRRAELISWQTGEIDNLTASLAEARGQKAKLNNFVKSQDNTIEGLCDQIVALKEQLKKYEGEGYEGKVETTDRPHWRQFVVVPWGMFEEGEAVWVKRRTE